MPIPLSNDTPLAAQVLDHTDEQGRPGALVVVKAAWRMDNGRLWLARDGGALRPKAQTRCLGDLDLDPVQRQVLGPALTTEVLWQDPELSPPKPGFDVLVIGHAQAPPVSPGDAPPVGYFDAGLRIGGHTVALRAFAPRVWRRRLGRWQVVLRSERVQRVPLTYALAFGGPLQPDNPAGLGAVTEPVTDGALLPWLERPEHLIRRPGDCPAPFSPGPWPTQVPFRRRHAGTFDDAWQQTRAPRPPVDFHPRFYNVAHPHLQLERAPAPGTPIRLVNLGFAPVWDQRYPTLTPVLEVWRRDGGRERFGLRADTLTLEPDAGRYALIWRAVLPDPATLTRVGLGVSP